MFRASVLTLYPEMFPGLLGQSLSGDGLARGLWSLEIKNIRDHGLGRHRAVDDTPAGGGAGMVLRADVLAAALDASAPADDPRPRLLMSPRGRPLNQARVRELSQGPGVIVICGRFEGVDERVIAQRQLEEVSIGDYILSGGEVASLVLILVCDYCRALWGLHNRGRRRALKMACSNIPIIHALAIGKACPFPLCCCQGIMRRLHAGAMSNRCN